MVKVLCYKSEGRWFDSIWCHLRSHYGPGVESASNRNKYKDYFLGVKTADNLPPSWATVTQSGNLNFLEPSGHLGPVMGLIYIFFFTEKWTHDMVQFHQEFHPIVSRYKEGWQACILTYLVTKLLTKC